MTDSRIAAVYARFTPSFAGSRSTAHHSELRLHLEATCDADAYPADVGNPLSPVHRLDDLVGNDRETGHRAWAERCHNRNVGGIASACHQDAADARRIVAGIER